MWKKTIVLAKFLNASWRGRKKISLIGVLSVAICLKKKVYKQMINIYHLFYHYLFQSRFQSLLSLFWGFLLKQKSVKGSVLNLVAVFSSVIKKYTDWTQPASFLCFFLQFVTLSWTSWVIPSAHVEEPSSTVRILLSN